MSNTIINTFNYNNIYIVNGTITMVTIIAKNHHPVPATYTLICGPVITMYGIDVISLGWSEYG